MVNKTVVKCHPLARDTFSEPLGSGLLHFPAGGS